MGRRLSLVLLVLLVGLVSGGLRAEPPPSVMLLEEPGMARPVLRDTLAIHLGGRATLRLETLPSADALPERIEVVGRALARAGAILGVWIEVGATNADGITDYVLFAVGRGDREAALLKVVKMRGEPGPDLDRALALKVGDMLDAILVPGGDPDLTAPVAIPLPPPKGPPSDVAASDVSASDEGAPSGRALLEIGATGALGGMGPQIGLHAAAGFHGRLTPMWAIEAYAAFRLPSDLSASHPLGEVTVEERAVGGGLRLLLASAWVAGGIDANLAARMLSATGTTVDARAGTAFRAVPSLGIGGEGRLLLGDHVAVRLAVGADIALVEQKYALEGVEVATVGRARPTGALTLIVFVP